MATSTWDVAYLYPDEKVKTFSASLYQTMAACQTTIIAISEEDDGVIVLSCPNSDPVLEDIRQALDNFSRDWWDEDDGSEKDRQDWVASWKFMGLPKNFGRL